MRDRIVKLDVREDLRRGREPLGKIMAAVSNLRKNEKLLLIAPFKPAPLYAVMEQKGFVHQEKVTSEGNWEILFSADSRKAPGGVKTIPSLEAHDEDEKCGCGCGRTILNLDARGLEPPQPLVTILEALSTLPREVELKAHTNRRPLHLYAHLDERGFIGKTEEQKDGSFITYIHRT